MCQSFSSLSTGNYIETFTETFMKVVAFLQNQWFLDPVRVKQIVETLRSPDECPHERREFHIAAFLFMGCLTGRRLRTTFGEDWTSHITWEEVSREYGGKASSVFPPDFTHIQDVLQRHQPTHVLALGKIAEKALKSIQGAPHTFCLVAGPHPASRSVSVTYRLHEIRKQLDSWKLLDNLLSK